MKYLQKIIGLWLLSNVVYILMIQVCFYLFGGKFGGDVSWGISIHYSYFAYAVMSFISVLFWYFKKRAITLIGLIVIYGGFVFYWKDAFNVYPNRTLLILALAFITYSVIHLILAQEANYSS